MIKRNHYKISLFLFNGVFKLAGDAGLAESAAQTANLIIVLDVFQVDILIITAFNFVVAGFGDGAGGTTGDAGFAALVDII